MIPTATKGGKWQQFLAEARQRLKPNMALEVSGTLTRLTDLVLQAGGLKLPVGAQCLVSMKGQAAVLAEVVGFSGDQTFLIPAAAVHGLARGALVAPLAAYVSAPRLHERRVGENPIETGVLCLPVGLGLLGRVVDAQGGPLDGLGPLSHVRSVPLDHAPINAMDRAPIRQSLDTGVRAINALLTLGRGQRIGLFAGSGIGKSVLLGMMARYTQADVIVVGLIGERGREIKEFIEDILGTAGRARSVVVAVPADMPPLLRLQGAAYASAVAESFRDQGRHVLLLMDSLTRYAMAQREIALALGEPPATKGYPPSCFTKLPRLVERSGNGVLGGGSITAIYTVLAEGDDQQDPVADAARAILDGHIVLSRSLAEAGHFPAIDVERSASRVMHNVVAKDNFEMARRFRALISCYERGRDLVQLGAYVSGSDAELDEAIRLHQAMANFLQQDMQLSVPLEESVRELAQSLSPPMSAETGSY